MANWWLCHVQLLGPLKKGSKIGYLGIFLSWMIVLDHSICAGQFHRSHKDMELEKQAMHSYPYVKLEPVRDTVVSPQKY